MLFLDKTIELNDTEMAIYNYIATNLDTVTYMRIRDLADATHVSTTTILRFCRKFSCSGFSEFRVKLQMYAQERTKINVDMSDETTYIDFLKRTAQPEFKANIEASAKILRDAELVLFVGIGSSGIIAEYGALYFSSLFTLALHIEDPLNHPFYHLSSKLSDKICMIAISVSGENEDIIKYIHQLKMQKCKIITITNSAKSTMAKLSDANISYYINKEMYQEADITSQLPAIYTVECIAREIRTQLDREEK
ncbi:SIS domain-containing protein [Listeria grandensis FSL F6-0971]|uniref:SIS domain-containing protein n=1 Tax=Listeria grandensis FSL F6-0971 TaxID=1265819 RepID=W7BQZ8_9LIST|nr:MurR/RpiR family transcriptional regulator [Listeria grandensis]EUJ22658.1 SIS domain-containing protein [Listeria grandensis FSL F6-0971]